MEHLQKVNHENIVRILGWVKWSFAIGIVLEYCEGGNLRDLLLDRSVPLDVPILVSLLSKTAKALDACHSLPSKRLIHGDVKPENVLLSKTLVPKLCDFGSAELATLGSSTTVNPAARSKREKIEYTPHYTAPEKLIDFAMKPTKELDVYAFAILMHMVLTRQIPYPTENPGLLDTIRAGARPGCQIIRERNQILNVRDKAVVEELEALMKRSWNQNPSARPTMVEVSRILQRLLDQQDPEVIEQQVAGVLRQMNLQDREQRERSQFIPLHQFCAQTSSFAGNKLLTINIPCIYCPILYWAHKFCKSLVCHVENC